MTIFFIYLAYYDKKYATVPGKRILMVADEMELKSAGGILLPSSMSKTTNTVVGEVVGVGEDVQTVTVGQRVMVSGYGASFVAVTQCGLNTHLKNNPHIFRILLF